MSRLFAALVIMLLLFTGQASSAQSFEEGRLDHWVAKYREYFYSDTLQARLHLDSINSELLSRTDTALYWKAKYKSEWAYTLAVHRLDYMGAVQLLKEALILYQQVGNQAEIASAESRIGTAFMNAKVYDSALYYISRGLEKNQLLNDEARANRGLGDMFIIYFYMGEYEQALSYIQAHVKKSKALQDSIILPQAYMNLAATFFRLEEYDSAKYYHFQSLYVARTDLDKAYSYLNIGEVYSNEDNLDSALHYYSKSQKLFQELDFTTGLNSNSLNLAKIYVKRRQFERALGYTLQSIKISEEMNDLPLLRDALEVKLAIEKGKSQFEDALKTTERITGIQDSLDSQLNKASMDELVTKYETRELEQKVEVQNARLSEQVAQLERNRFLTIALIVTIVSVLALWLLNRSRLRKKQQILLQQERLNAKEAEINATISSQEKERARYARDLHDGFGQMISILNMNLGNLRSDSKPDERQRVFEESEKVVNEMYDELKGICFDLMPQTLVQHGLQSGLEEFAERINKADKLFIETDFFGLEERLDEIQEISLYRISQEWINNILKYSDADKVTLQVTKDDTEITLLIEDNGAGFDKSMLLNSKGNGWKNLHTRTNLIQGELELETQPGTRGTTLIVNAPTTLVKEVETLENSKSLT